jgi:cobalt-zinc-cadmium efflux system membrane fusion protein
MKILFLTVILVGAAFAAEAPTRNENTVVLDAIGIQNLGIETVSAEESTFESTLTALGEIEHTCESHSVLSSRIAGKIVEVLAHKGDFIKKGDVLLRVESRQLGDPPPTIDLTAPADGLVTDSRGHLGAPVEPDHMLMEIIDLKKVWVVSQIPQHQAAWLKTGLTARIRIPALGTGEQESTFLRLGTGDESRPSSVDAIFELANPETKLRPGMRAEVSLITNKRDHVLSIPREALQGDRSNRFVFIKDYELKNAFVRIPVTIGEINHDRVEITSGLFPGDEVVLKGAYALSFAGKGSASLKEALDAAHGHPHNEDGTEMSAEEIAASSHDHDHIHDHENADPLVIFLAIACGMLLVLVSILLFRNRSKA